MALAKMRTLDEAYREIKQLDPNTAISKYFIRQLALSGAVPTVMCGRRRLINLDGLIAYLNGDAPSTTEKPPRLVDVRPYRG